MEFQYQLRMAFADGNVDFAELPCGKWEWDSVEELRAEWDALMLYVNDYEPVAYFITKAWGDGVEVDMDYEVIWDSDGDCGEYSDDILKRRKWVEDYNNSLPQKKWFDTEFEKEMSIGIGGIYDSEYMNFIYDNIKSKRIRELLKKE